MKTKTIDEDTLFVSCRMSNDEYKLWKASTLNIFALRPTNETSIIVTNTKLLIVANKKPLI
jgi:hypothetical protein